MAFQKDAFQNSPDEESLLGDMMLGDDLLGGGSPAFQVEEDEESEAVTYYAHAQAQALIKQVYYVHGQAQARIKNTYFGLGQAQALIGSRGNGCGQAQAYIKALISSHGQAQALIKTVTSSHGQAQANVKTTYFGLGQAQGLIGTLSYAHGQAQATVKAINSAHGQSQGQIKATYFGLGQAQAEIDSDSITAGFGQAQASIVAQYYQLLDTFDNRAFGPFSGSTQNPFSPLKLDMFNYPNTGQYTGVFLFDDHEIVNNRLEAALTSGGSTYLETIVQASDITTYFDFFANTYGAFAYHEIFYTNTNGSRYADGYYNQDDAVFGIDFDDDNVEVAAPALEDGEAYRFMFHMGNGIYRIKLWKLSDPEPVEWSLEVAHGSFTADRAQFGVNWDDPATTIWVDNATVLIPQVPIVQRYGQAQAYILGYTQKYGQARARIKAVGVNRSAQARARIKGLGRGLGQAQARIKHVGNNPSAQAQALINSITKNVYGQAQAYIDSQIKVPSGQAQALIANPSYLLVDTFTRVLAGSLGTPDVGAVWQPFSAGDLDQVIVDGSKALVEKTTIFYQYASAKNAVGVGNAELTADIFVTVPLEESFYIEFGLRNNGSNIGTGAWYQYGEGTWEAFSFGPGITPTAYTGYGLIEPNRLYKVRLITQDFRFRFKIWDAEYPEPETWTIDVTDSNFVNHNGSTTFYIDRGGATVPNDYVSLDNYIVKRASTERSGQAQAFIAATPTLRAYGQAQAKIIASGVNRSGQAQASIYRSERYGQAQAYIKQVYLISGQARALIEQRHRWFGQAQAMIRNDKSYGQAMALIVRPQGYGQAQAFIAKTVNSGQAQGTIKTVGRGYGQAAAKIFGRNRGLGQAQAFIRKSVGYGQAQGYITGNIFTRSAQAQAYIALRGFATGQARAVIVKAQPHGQAQAYISAFNRVVRGNAQALIKKAANTKSGQAQGFILAKGAPASGQAAALILSAKYLTRFNNYDLPGYAQEEHVDSIVDIFHSKAEYEDGSFAEYVGLKNKILSLRMKVLDTTYGGVKKQVQRAFTMLRSTNGYTKLYLQNTDKYYLALTSKVTTEKTVTESMKQLDYTVEFETKPWVISDAVYTITGTGTIDTDTVLRDYLSGGWSPVTLRLSGNDITVSGYSIDGQLAGYISVSGAVNDLVINSEEYTATINNVNVNEIMNTPNYVMYVAPGKTTFVITGATDAEISWQNRWYL